MGILDDAIREHLELKRQHGVPEEELRRQEEEALGPARRNVAPAETDQGDGEVEDDLSVATSGERELSETDEPVADDELLQAGEPPDPEMAPFGVQEETALHEEATAARDDEMDLPEGEAALREKETTLLEEAPALDREEPALDREEPALDREEPALDREEPALDREEPALTQEDPGLDPEQPALDRDEPAATRTGETPPSGFDSLDDDELLDEDGEPEGDQGDVLEDTPDFLQETPEHDRLWFEQKPPRDFDFD